MKTSNDFIPNIDEVKEFYDSLSNELTSFDLMFSKSKELTFLDIKFDFKIKPHHFIKWLSIEGEEITGKYSLDVSSMCEYSCLYIGMLLYDKKLDGDMKIYYGKFGFWEHYWIGYQLDNKEYFIDLTLRQFIDAPKLAITNSMNERIGGSYSYLSDGEPIRDYVDRKEGFKFYTNPLTMENPSIKFNF